MAYSFTAGAGSTAASDEIAGEHHALVKLSLGGAGATAMAVGGSGAAGTNTIRVIAATDSPEVTALQIMDDWDESDRAKVNLIVGQAGVAGGSGTVGATVQRVVLATDVGLPAGTSLLGSIYPEGREYEAVAASQTDQVLGPTGATGDYLAAVVIVPANLNPGQVQIQDGAGTAITIFTGGTDSVATLHPFVVPLGIASTGGAWSLTTGASVSAIGIGSFT